jgi:hypothetical protein
MFKVLAHVTAIALYLGSFQLSAGADAQKVVGNAILGDFYKKRDEISREPTKATSLFALIPKYYTLMKDQSESTYSLEQFVELESSKNFLVDEKQIKGTIALGVEILKYSTINPEAVTDADFSFEYAFRKSSRRGTTLDFSISIRAALAPTLCEVISILLLPEMNTILSQYNWIAINQTPTYELGKISFCFELRPTTAVARLDAIDPAGERNRMQVAMIARAMDETRHAASAHGAERKAAPDAASAVAPPAPTEVTEERK